MKKLFLAGAILFAGFAAQASTNGSITGLLGFSQSAVNFGVNYENRLDSAFGLGGFFHFSSEKKENAAKQQTMAFGAMAPAHLLDNARFDAYVAPGFAVIMVKGYDGAPYSKDDQTTFGPIWKMGVMFRMSTNVKVGIEQTELINWFTDKASPQVSYTNAALEFSF
jgi:opacity protein-like surface antigen